MPGQSRYFATVAYPEHIAISYNKELGTITEEVKLEIRDAIIEMQIPCAYAIHDKDTVTKKDVRDFKKNNPEALPEEYPVLGSLKPAHIHMLFVFNNTTTIKAAQSAVNVCALPNHTDLINNKVITTVRSVSGYYDYLIHDRDCDREDGKYQYDTSERYCLNGFNPENYISENIIVGDGEKISILKDIDKLIQDKHFTEVDDVYQYVTNSDNGFNEKYQKVCFDKIQTLGQFCLNEYHRLVKLQDEIEDNFERNRVANDIEDFKNFVEKNNIIPMKKNK